MAKTRDFSAVIRKRLASDADLAASVEKEAFNANLAIQIYDARISAGLTQKQLADRIGSQQSVIARLEDADYDGHSLSILRRIASALDCALSVEFFRKSCLADAGIVTTDEFNLVITAPAKYPSPASPQIEIAGLGSQSVSAT